MWKDTNVSAYLSRRKEKKKLTKKMRKEDEVLPLFQSIGFIIEYTPEKNIKKKPTFK